MQEFLNNQLHQALLNWSKSYSDQDPNRWQVLSFARKFTQVIQLLDTTKNMWWKVQTVPGNKFVEITNWVKNKLLMLLSIGSHQRIQFNLIKVPNSFQFTTSELEVDLHQFNIQLCQLCSQLLIKTILT